MRKLGVWLAVNLIIISTFAFAFSNFGVDYEKLNFNHFSFNHSEGKNESIEIETHDAEEREITQLPDVAVISLTWSNPIPSDGTIVTIYAQVKNVGEIEVKDSIQCAFYIDGEQIIKHSISCLDRNDTKVLQAEIRPEPGVHTIRFMVDCEDAIWEANETNNVMLSEMSVEYPNLVVKNLDYYPKLYSDGEKVTFFVELENKGFETTRTFLVSFYLDGERASTKPIQGMSSGGDAVISFECVLAGGAHFVRVEADSNNDIIEYNETDNMESILIECEMPDLYIEKGVIQDANLVDGMETTIEVKLINAGGATYSTFFVDMYVDGKKAGSKGLYGLGNRTIEVLVYNWTVEGGVHDIGFVVDSSDSVKERCEWNNYYYLNTSISYPDLEVSEIEIPSMSPADGEVINISVAITNIGDGATSARFLSILYVDGKATDYEYVNGLEVMERKYVQFTWLGESGMHDILVVVNGERVVKENAYWNNEGYYRIEVLRPDLEIVSAFYAPEEPAIGENVTISVIVKNNGPGYTIRGVPIDLYTKGIKLGSMQIPSLPEGSQTTVIFSYISKGGVQPIKIIIDRLNEFKESNESNNEFSIVIESGYADYVLQELTWTPANPTIGTLVQISCTVVNLGVSVNMFTKVNFSVNGMEVGEIGCPALPQGGGAVITCGWVATCSILKVSSKADSRNDILETNEANNWLSKDALGNVLEFNTIEISIKSISVYGGGGIGSEISISANLTSNSDASIKLSLYSETENIGATDVLIRGNQDAFVIFKWRVRSGLQNFVIRADSDERYDEANEEDNFARYVYTYQTADLLVSSLSWTEGGIDSGGDFVVFANVENVGLGNITKEVSAILCVDGATVAGVTLPNSISGTKQVVSFLWKAKPGSHAIRVCVDKDGDYNEDNETNNEVFATIFIENPQLTVTSLNYTEGKADESGIVEIYASIKNVGSAGIDEQIEVMLIIDGLECTTQSFDGLETSLETTLKFTYKCKPGMHLISLWIDKDAKLLEFSRDDNRRSIFTINVSAPDITVTELFFVRSYASLGEEPSVYATVWNGGNGDTLGNFELKFLLDGKKVGSVNVQGLLSGTSTTIAMSVKAQAHFGINKIGAIVDSTNVVYEDEEGNNFKVCDGFNTEYPNLRCRFVFDLNSSSAKGCDGLRTPVFVKIENDGGFICREFKIGFYIDGLLIENRIISGLGFGNTTIPFYYYARAGLHQAKVIVDLDREIEEWNENDNQATAYLPAYEYPNFVPEEIKTVRLGASYLTSVSIRNTGWHTLSQFKVWLYGDEQRLGEQTINGLPGCETASFYIEWNSKNKPNKLLVRVDATREIIESREDDNELEIPFTVVDTDEKRPDYKVGEIKILPEYPCEGTYTRIYISVENIGGYHNFSKGVKIELIDNNSMIGSFGRKSRSVQIGVSSQIVIPGVKTFVVMDWVASSGNHTFTAKVSTSEKEDNDMNNIGIGNYMVEYVDLSLIDFQASPLNATDGEKVTIFARFMNIGKAALERSVYVELFVEGISYAKSTIYGMLPNETCEIAFTWQATPGANEIAIYLAREDELFELKTDNYIITTLNVVYPDILASDILSAYTNQGSSSDGSLWVFAKVDALGNLTTGGFSTRIYYVEIYDNGRLSWRGQVYGIAPGRQAWVSFELPSVNSTVKIFADSTNIVKEGIETNNMISKKMPDGGIDRNISKPDVTIVSTSYKQSNADGANIENRLKLNITIANIGENEGKGIKISVICDGIQVGTISVVEVGLGEKNYEFTFSPSTRAHRIKVIADCEYTLAETTETNNYAILFVSQNTPPFVMLTTDRIYAEVGVPVSFIADGLDNDDGVPTYFAWDFDGDGKFDWESNTVSTATFVYKKNGTYLARLYVLDSKGASAEGLVYVFVKNPKPKPPKTEDYKQYWITLNIVSLAILTGVCYYIVRSERSKNGTKDRKKEKNKKVNPGLQNMNKNKVDSAK